MSKFDYFCSEPMGNKPVSELPGVGKATADGLNCMGFYKAKDVYEKLRQVGFDEDRFCSWLSGNFRGCRAGDCYDALMEWHDRFGARNATCGNSKSKKFQPAQVETSKYDNFCYEPMDHKLVSDIPGVGDVTARRLNSMGYYRAKDLYEKLRKYDFDEETFCEWMSDNFRGCRARDCYDALMEWHDQFGATVRRSIVPEREHPPPLSPRSLRNQNAILGLFVNLENPTISTYLQNPRSSQQLHGNPRTFGQRIETARIPEESVLYPRTSDRPFQNLRTIGQILQNRAPQPSSRNYEQMISYELSPENSEPSFSNSRAFRQSVQNPRTSESLAENLRAFEQSGQNSRTTEQSVQSLRTSEQSAQNPRTSELSAQNAETSEETVPNSRTSEQSVQSPSTSEQSVQDPRTSDQPDPDPLAAFFQTMEATVKNLPNLPKAVAAFAPKPDPIKAFFQSMQETVRTFEPELISEMKSEIFKIVSDYERRVLRVEPAVSSPSVA